MDWQLVASYFTVKSTEIFTVQLYLKAVNFEGQFFTIFSTWSLVNMVC